jgi:hypothetical protein
MFFRMACIALAGWVAAVSAACQPATPAAEAPASAAAVGAPVQPAPRDMSTPEAATLSYLEWVSYSYLIADAEVPVATMTAAEAVRVDAYIQLNRMKGQGIHQMLESFAVSSVKQDPTGASVVARESWRYRYFSLETHEYTGGWLAASYDATYTLVPGPEGWLVDRVDVTALESVR